MNQLPSFIPARILVVDDEHAVRSTLTHPLSLIGYQVDSAGSGVEALKMLARHSYDLLVLDLQMPHFSGIEVMDYAAQHYPKVLIIVLTAHATLESAITAVKRGAVDYLLKPSSHQTIVMAIQNALKQRADGQPDNVMVESISRAMELLQSALNSETAHEAHEDKQVLATNRYIRCGSVTLDQNQQIVFLPSGHSATLTANEMAFLAYFMQHPDTVLTLRKLAYNVLGYDVSVREASEVIRPHISRLRKKLQASKADPQLIQTVRGKGYLFRAE